MTTWSVVSFKVRFVYLELGSFSKSKKAAS
jgi:hypothetical protein